MADKTCNTCKANKICDHNKFGFENCGNYIPLDVTEVRRGEWKYEGEYKACSHCGTFVEWNTLGMAYWNYCPCCGAKITEVTNENKTS